MPRQDSDARGRRSDRPRGAPRQRDPQNYFRSGDNPSTGDGEPVEGTVAWYDTQKGYGFVELEGGRGSAFLHATALASRRLHPPPDGTRLLGRVGEGPRGLQMTEVLQYLRDEPEGAPRSAPRDAREATPEVASTPLVGTVKWYDRNKGFGFVGTEDGGGDVLLRAAVLERTCMPVPREGERLMVLVIAGERGREAISVAPGAPPPPPSRAPRR
jgi:CspA family cold shock protein